MDKIQKVLVNAGRKDLAQEYYKKLSMAWYDKEVNLGDKIRIQMVDVRDLLDSVSKFINADRQWSGELGDVKDGTRTGRETPEELKKMEDLLNQIIDKYQRFFIGIAENFKDVKSISMDVVKRETRKQWKEIERG